MPPQRAPLGTISGNRFKGCQISPYMRGQVAGQARRGAKPTAIARDLSLDRGTVQYTLKQDAVRDEGKTLSKKARNKSYTAAEERKLLRHVRANPKDSYADVIRACNWVARNLRSRRSSRSMASPIAGVGSAQASQKLKLPNDLLGA